MDLDNKTFIHHDIETYINFFCVVFKYEDRYNVFEISERKDDTLELIDFLHKCHKNKWYLVGFNSVRFDGQVLQWLIDNYKSLKDLKGDVKANKIYEFAQEVISKTSNKQFAPYPEYKLSNQHIDLFLQNHYNNMARATSLKWLEYSMNWTKIQDLPYKHDEILSIDRIDDVIKYCVNDVDATNVFFDKCDKLIELRFSQQENNSDLNLLNKSDSSVGELLFLDLMSKKLNIDKNKLKKKQTHHSKIKLRDVILPYIHFDTEEFNGVLEFFKETEITSTNKAFKHIIEYKGIEYHYGTGGLHASWNNKIFESTEEKMILDLDVASFYPNISIKNRLYPKHLSSAFCELYEEIFETRKKIPKSNPQNKSLKLLLNSIYGKSGDIYSFVYDKFFQMSITVNGQLLLSMLAEKLSMIESVNVIQANTDGVTIELSRDQAIKNRVYAVWKWFEKMSKLTLEHAVYDKMFLRDVNNYIAVYENGDIKYKGAFEIDVEFHKNRSQRIVPIAVKRYLIHNVPVEETIQNHLSNGDYGDIENQGIYDFCIGKKIKWNQNYTLEQPIEREVPKHSQEERIEFVKQNGWKENDEGLWKNKKYHKKDDNGDSFSQAYNKCLVELYPDFKVIKDIDDKVIRFYVSNKGNYLTKNYSDGRRETSVGGNKVTMFMDYYESEDYDINYRYYIDEAYKIIHQVDGTAERLAEEARIEREKLKEQRKREREEEQRNRQKEMYIKYCVEKNPTEKQYERYKADWLIELYGEPEEIRPSK